MKKLRNALIVGASICALPIAANAQGLAEAPAVMADKSVLTPEQAVQLFGKDISAGKLVSLWDTLPASYQKDVQALVTDFGKNVDPEIYKESFGTLKLAVDTIEKKEALLFNLVQGINPDAAGVFGENFDNIIKVLKGLTESDIKTLEGFKKLQVAEFAKEMQPNAANISLIIENLLNSAVVAPNGEAPDKFDLKNIKVKTLKQDANSATVEVERDNGDTQKTELIKKEGRWIPKEMVDEWDEKIKEAQEEIAALSKMTPEDKQEVLQNLQQIKTVINIVDNSNTPEELMQNLGPIMGPILGGGF